MATYALKTLREMSNERLIGLLAILSHSETKSTRMTEDKIFKVLSERGVIDYDAMKNEYKRILIW